MAKENTRGSIFVQGPNEESSREIKNNEELGHLFNIHWLESIPLVHLRRHNGDFRKSQPNLMIRHMNDTVGYGVFAKDFIPKGAFVCIYAGVIEMAETKPSNAYLHQIAENVVIDAEKQGNISRFLQHAPSAEDLTKYYTIKLDAMQVCSSNLEKRYIKSKGTSIQNVAFYAQRDIEPGEMLTIDYSMKYWSVVGVEPSLFNRCGGPLLPGKDFLPKRCIYTAWGKGNKNLSCADEGLAAQVWNEAEEVRHMLFSGPEKGSHLVVPTKPLLDQLKQNKVFLFVEGRWDASEDCVKRHEKENLLHSFRIRHYKNPPQYNPSKFKENRKV